MHGETVKFKNALLYFHSNNGYAYTPQCYTTCSLHIILLHRIKNVKIVFINPNHIYSGTSIYRFVSPSP